MKQQVEDALQCLISLPFWGAGRITNLLTFQFGPRQLRADYHGKTHEVGTYALHVQCAWRITQAQHILVASGDRFYEPGDDETMTSYEGEAYAWSKTEHTLLDERLLRFFLQCERAPIFVQAIQADEFGGLTILLSNDHMLTVFPEASFEAEHWRFFQPARQDLPHFVATSEGIEDPDEEFS